MSRLITHDNKIIWNSKLSQEESHQLALLIEEQTGIVLPEKHNNNPFEYKGDIEIRIYYVTKDNITARKAKAPFGQDMYYQVILDNAETYSFGKFHFLNSPPDGEWYPVDPLTDIQRFEPFISLVETINRHNRWQLEEPKLYTRYYKQSENRPG